MHKIRTLFTLLLFFTGFAHASDFYSLKADSITYQLYLKGDWDSLIVQTNEILKQGVDFKTLRQRMGYAYFLKGNYFLSRWHYEKALAFDKTDEISNLYLYYCGLYTADESYTRFYASKLNDNYKKEYGIKAFRPLNAFDFEYNRKTENITLNRSGVNYIRLGLNSEPTYNFSVYLSFSKYMQALYNSGKIDQTGYYILGTWNPSANVSVSGGFHYLNCKADSSLYHSNMFFGKIGYKKYLFDAALMASTFKNSAYRYNQVGVHLGLTLPELKSLYLQAEMYRLTSTMNGNWVYNQCIGFMPLRKCWFEVFATEGKQENYTDMNGIYIYNSDDYSTFKSGGTLFYYLNNHITIYTNYTYDVKHIFTEEMIDMTNTLYNQHSITGGIIWKL